MSNDMKSFRSVLESSKNIIAVAGAGLSAASGIPTFRGAGGMWRKYDAMSLATPEAFARNPSLVWQFYHYRREKARMAKPNAAHLALASFSLPSVRQLISPGSTFSLITQNVDGLSQISLDRVSSSALDSDLSQTNTEHRILEKHGKLFEVQCTSDDCGYAELNFDSPICEALAGTENEVEKGVLDSEIPVSSLPRCSKCSALARPGVVWFGEMPRHLDTIVALVDKADLCLVVGTSSTVYPAAQYAHDVLDQGGKVAVFNLDRSQGDEDADFLFLGPCEELLPQALGMESRLHS